MNGVLRLFRPLYSPLYERYIRHHLPRKYTILNGVVTRSSRILDPIDHYPNHKRINVEEIQKHVKPNDVVVEVGSGYGVCTVWAARKASHGEVTSYEGGLEMYNIAQDAIELNSSILDDNIDSRVFVSHTIVGDPEDVWGSEIEAERLPAEQLPECDVLITDCEGSELDIVQQMKIKPRVAIIETHPELGSKTADVVETFQTNGYTTEIRSEGNDSEVEVVIAQK